MARFEKEGYRYKGFELGETVKLVKRGEETRIIGFDTGYRDDLCVLVSNPNGCRYNVNGFFSNDIVILNCCNTDICGEWVTFNAIGKYSKDSVNFYPNRDAKTYVEYQKVFDSLYVVRRMNGTVDSMSEREFDILKQQLDDINRNKVRCKIDDRYYYANALGEVADCCIELGTTWDTMLFEAGNYFHTREEAEEVAREFKNILNK